MDSRNSELYPPEACPLCGSTDHAPFLPSAVTHYRRCVACSLVFLARLPDPLTRQNLYQASYFASPDALACGYADYAGQERELTETARRYLQQIMPLLARRQSLIDLGCGYGYLLAAARSGFHEVTGIDLSPAVAPELLRRQLPHYIADVAGLPAGAIPAADLVTMFDFLEHCPDPHAIFRFVRQAITPGGLVAILTPDCDGWLRRFSGRRWVSLKQPEHVLLYNRRSLCRLLAGHGFTPLHIAAGRQMVTVPFAARRLAGLFPPLAPLFRAAARLFPHSSWWLPNGNLFVIARRTATPPARAGGTGNARPAAPA